MEEREAAACPLCAKELPRIEEFNKNINQAKTPEQKAPFAKELLNLVESLISQHKTELPCLGVLKVRKQAAQLILKVASLRRE